MHHTEPILYETRTDLAIQSTGIEYHVFGKGSHSHSMLDSVITTHLVLIRLEDGVVW